eukprot:6626880-Prymnesium_polylepis.1
MRPRPQTAPQTAYMTGNGTVFRDQTICRYVAHPQHPAAAWKASKPTTMPPPPYRMGRQQNSPTLTLPPY